MGGGGTQRLLGQGGRGPTSPGAPGAPARFWGAFPPLGVPEVEWGGHGGVAPIGPPNPTPHKLFGGVESRGLRLGRFGETRGRAEIPPFNPGEGFQFSPRKPPQKGKILKKGPFFSHPREQKHFRGHETQKGEAHPLGFFGGGNRLKTQFFWVPQFLGEAQKPRGKLARSTTQKHIFGGFSFLGGRGGFKSF